LLNLDVRTSSRQFDSLVVLIDRDGQTLLRFVLANDVLFEESFDLAGLGQRWPRSYRLSLLFIADNLITDVDALVADIDGGTCNEFLNFVLRFPAKRTTQRFITSSHHSPGN